MILCAPKPAWVKAAEQPTRYDSIDYFMRTVIGLEGDRAAKNVRSRCCSPATCTTTPATRARTAS